MIRTTAQKTSLYDPITGCIYAHDLFEKDLYREKILESRLDLGSAKNTAALQPKTPHLAL